MMPQRKKEPLALYGWTGRARSGEEDVVVEKEEREIEFQILPRLLGVGVRFLFGGGPSESWRLYRRESLRRTWLRSHYYCGGCDGSEGWWLARSECTGRRVALRSACLGSKVSRSKLVASYCKKSY